MYIDENDIINFAKKSPKAIDVFNRYKSIIEQEHEKRQRFYEEVTENQKAEFINGEVIIHSPVKLKHNQTSINLALLVQSFISKKKSRFGRS